VGIGAAALLVDVSMLGYGGVEQKLLALGGLVVGAGVAAVKMAGDFQASMTSLVTGAGESVGNLKMVSDGILKMAVQTGTSTTDLAAGMYMIESAGFHGAAGLAVLQAAAEGAKVGAAKLADVANGVTTMMVDYAKSHITAAQATNILIAAVSLGKTHMQDLATAMSTILPTSSAVGVSIKDVSGAMATMTAEGTNAAAAATYLRQLLMALEAPASKGAKELAAIGLTTAQVSDSMKKSLPATLQMITDALAKKFPVGSAAYVEALKNIAGGSRQMQGILELTGTHLQTFKNDVAGVTDAMNKGGNSITGWNLVQQDFNTKLDQAWQTVQVLFIKIGTQLLPVLGQMFDIIAPILTQFGNWVDQSHFLTNAFATLTGWVGYVQAAFKDVFDPIHATYTVMSDLADTFDRATKSFSFTVPAVKALTDTFDRAKNIINSTSIQPMLDSFDRAKSVLSTPPANPWVNFFTSVKGTWDKLVAIDWGKIGANFQKVGDAISKVDWGKVGAAINQVGTVIGNVSLAIGKVDWGKIFKAITDGAHGLWDVLNKNLGPEVKDLGNNISQNLWPALKDLGTSLVPLLPALKDIGIFLGGAFIFYLKAAILTLDGLVTVLTRVLNFFTWANNAAINFANTLHNSPVGQAMTNALHAAGIPGFASGTSSAPGGMAMVGEQGPELMYVPRGASIYPHGSSMTPRAVGGGVSAAQPINVNVYLDGAPVAKKLMPHIAQQIRQATGAKF
jgi:TP901 family phage tail tape measure protein